METPESLFEIINPSDAYTIRSDNWKVACLATVILGSGHYGLDEIGGDRHMPIFLFGGHDEWFAEQFGQTFEQALDDVPKHEIAKCMDTVLIGSVSDRKTYEEGLRLIDDPAKRHEWYEHWHDQHRSSMNDIGGRAKAYAQRMMESNQSPA